MVRKTTAKVKDTARSWYDGLSSHDWSIADMITRVIEFVQQYWMTVLGLVLLLIGLIQLSEILIGTLFVITGILLIGGFFKDPGQK